MKLESWPSGFSLANGSTWVAFHSHLRYLDCRFEVIAIDPLSPGEFLTNTIRGGFGYRLKELVCTESHGHCPKCNSCDVCVYPSVFEPALNMPSDKLGPMTSPPAPYLFRMDSAPSRIPPGGVLRFTLRVFGRVVCHVPQLVAALSELGRYGLGIRKSRFRLDRVRGAVSPFPLFQRSTTTPAAIGGPVADLGLLAAPVGDQHVRSVAIRFTMPVLVKSKGMIARDLTFGLLVEHISRRLHLLQRFYDPPANADIVHASTVTGVQCTSKDLRWRHLRRFSTRQQAVIPMGGLIGSVTFEGELAPYLPLLRAGQIVHLGKGAAFGLGRYDLILPILPPRS